MNDTHTSGSVGLDFTLYVGSNEYPVEYSSGPDLFPDTSGEQVVEFDIAPGVTPTKLKVGPSLESMLPSLLPFYDEQEVYDLR